MAASRPSMRVISSSHDAMRCLNRQLSSLEVGSSVAAGVRASRNFSSSCRVQAGAEEQQQSQPQAQPSATKSTFASIFTSSPSATSSASTSTSTTPRFTPKLPVTPATIPGRRSTATPYGSSYSSRQSARAGAPYRLHAHCTKHNTILALTRDLPPSEQDLNERKDARTMLNTFQRGQDVAKEPVDPKILGQTVLKVSPGMLGLKKAQRGTFEAASRASVKMFNMMQELGGKERTNKHGQRVKDEQVGSLELIFKGFGQGREALVAAINSSQGDEVRRKIHRVTDATPIKIGGVRPKKRRKLSPPLDLSKRRK